MAMRTVAPRQAAEGDADAEGLALLAPLLSLVLMASADESCRAMWRRCSRSSRAVSPKSPQPFPFSSSFVVLLLCSVWEVLGR